MATAAPLKRASARTADSWPSRATPATWWPNDSNGLQDVFLRDLLTQTTTLVSANGAGTDSGKGDSFDGLLSADGSTIVFVSLAADLVPADTNGVRDVFAAHLQAQSTVVLIAAPQLPSLSINDVTVTEGNSGTVNATFTVSLSAASSQPVTVSFATADGNGHGHRRLRRHSRDHAHV